MNTYTTHGTCSLKINFEVEDNIVKSVNFVGGCSGNTQGVSKLVEGMEIHEVISRLSVFLVVLLGNKSRTLAFYRNFFYPR